MTQLADDSKAILAKTYPESRYVTGKTDTVVVGVLEEGRRQLRRAGDRADSPTKPWWQFWD